MNTQLSTSVSLNQTVLGLLNDNLCQHGAQTFQLDRFDLETLNTFHERSVATLGVEGTRHIYQREGLRLAIEVGVSRVRRKRIG